MQTTSATKADFADFCERHYPNLVGLLGLFCGNRELGEEFAQETLMRAYRDWSKVRSYDSPAAWLYRVGTNLARSHFRRKRAEGRAKARLEREPAPRASEPALVLEIRDAIARLPMRMRTAVVLRFYGGLRISEIADALECSESTVKKLLRRAIVRFREEDRIADGKESWDAS